MSEVEKYLQKVSAGLYRLPNSEQSEILGEIRNHIHEAESRQEPVHVVLSILDFFIDIPWHDGVTFFSDTVHTGFPALVMSLMLGAVLFFLGILCRKLLKKYLVFISLRYKKFRMGK